jgi:trk system potassium uptake protein TrkH
MSGFTATGLTMFQDVENLPQSILFWRSFTQWIGGVGVIVLFLSILIRSSGIAAKLYKAEGRTDRIAHNIVSTARRIWLIYILYTVLCILGLIALMGPDRAFDAVNVGMTCLAISHSLHVIGWYFICFPQTSSKRGIIQVLYH